MTEKENQMSNTNNAVETVATTTVDASIGNASKKQAKAITETVMGHRNDRSAASKAVTDLNKKLGEALLNGGMTKEQLHVMIESAKAAVLAGLDRIEERANALRSIPRGTTGEGGIHRDDAVAEVFAPGSKKGAIERNTAALKKSGHIS
jgi:hypothetical protein